MQVSQLPINPEGMETTKHGSFAFPLAIYHSRMSKNVLGHTPWHWHGEIQFCLVTDGELIFSVNEKQVSLETGEGIFVNSGYLHMAKPSPGTDAAYICLDADPKLLSCFPGSLVEQKYVQPFLADPAMADFVFRPVVPWQKQVLEQIAQAYAAFERMAFGDELRLMVLLTQMWLALLENRPRSSLQNHRRLQENTLAQGVMTYLSRNYDRRVSLEEIAQAVSFSASECCRVFKKVTGETIFEYLRSYRLARSMELLRNTQLSVSQIAYDTGFCSTSYLIETFKASFGITPLQYRKTGCQAGPTAASCPDQA